MKRLFWSACLIALATASPAAEIGRQEVKAVLDRVLVNYATVESRNYHVKLNCPELEASVQAAFALMMPLPVTPNLMLVNSNGQHMVTINADAYPEPLRDRIGKKVKQLAGPYIGFAEKSTAREIDGFIRAVGNSAQFDVIKSDDATLDFEINEINEPFFGRTARSGRLKIDRKTGVLERVTFVLNDGKTMTMNLHHTPHDFTTDKQKAQLIDRVDVDHTAFLEGGMKLPQKFSVLFENYEFSPK